jgi:hypothetical protein
MLQMEKHRAAANERFKVAPDLRGEKSIKLCEKLCLAADPFQKWLRLGRRNGFDGSDGKLFVVQLSVAFGLVKGWDGKFPVDFVSGFFVIGSLIQPLLRGGLGRSFFPPGQFRHSLQIEPEMLGQGQEPSVVRSGFLIIPCQSVTKILAI